MPACWKQMKKIALVFILLVGGSVLLPSIAQNKDWHLTRYATIDGLASSDITTLFQDADHFLWIGHSAGVSRFDGYSFENLLSAGNHRIGRVYAIIEDKKQTIWIGAEGGLFFFR